MKHCVLLCALPLLALSAVAVRAQGPGGPPRRVVLEALDADHDGQLSAMEIAAASQSLLKLDRNGDGQVTSAEYSPKLEDKTSVSDLEQRLMLLDKNGDDVLTADEMPERMKPIFERGDTNHDGKLTKDEMRTMSGAQADPQGRPVGRGNFNSMDPIMLVLDVDKDGVLSAVEIANAPVQLKTLDANGDGALAADEIRMKQQTPRQRAEHLFDEWDTNKDGALLKEEMPDRMQTQFETIDTNHDGKVDMEEATAYMEKMPVQGRGPGGARAGGEGQARQ